MLSVNFSKKSAGKNVQEFLVERGKEKKGNVFMWIDSQATPGHTFSLDYLQA